MYNQYKIRRQVEDMGSPEKEQAPMTYKEYMGLRGVYNRDGAVLVR